MSNAELGDVPVPSHLDDAVASLEIDLTDDEGAELKAPYKPLADFQACRTTPSWAAFRPDSASSSPEPDPTRRPLPEATDPSVRSGSPGDGEHGVCVRG